MTKAPYNPLDKLSLAKSIEFEILLRPPMKLGEVPEIKGAGIYVIYYNGAFPSYQPIVLSPDHPTQPIYVGKAIPKGGRKGGLTKDSAKGTALRDRLRQHASSIKETSNLEIDAFSFRHLVVEDIWIPLGENALIESFKPVWNGALDGFGNKDPGKRRSKQFKSPWDVLHPGRAFTVKLAESPVEAPFLEERLADFFEGRPLKPLPKKLAKQIEEQEREAEEEADNIEL